MKRIVFDTGQSVRCALTSDASVRKKVTKYGWDA